jgi:hypothetical protein
MLYKYDMSFGPGPAESTPTTYDIASMRLRTEFQALLGSVPLGDCIVPAHLRSGYREPEDLDQYALVPITGSLSQTHTSTTRAGFSCDLPEGFIVSYKGNAKPCMDTMFGVGLGFNEVVIALAAGCIPYEGPLRLRIDQIQGLVTDSQKSYKRGLQGGFLWRDTLVHAWAAVARRLNIGILEIQAAENNFWWMSAKDRQDQMKRGLDDVAERMRFRRDDYTKNWFISLGRVVTLPSIGEPLPLLQPPSAQIQ